MREVDFLKLGFVLGLELCGIGKVILFFKDFLEML